MSDKDLICLNNVDIHNAPEVIYCERERLTKATRFGPVIRRFFVVECNESGYGAVIINGVEHPFGPKQCYVLFPGDTVTHISDGEHPRSGIYCILDAPMLALQFQEAGITSEMPFIPDHMFPQVQQWLERMLDDFKKSDAGTPMRQASNIYGLAGTLLQEKPVHARTGTISKSIGIMEANYPNSISTSQLAQAVGLERTYFSCLFKEKTGYTPHRYLTILRIQKACLLLAETELSITQIADLVGLDMRNFARLFKKEIGKTPFEYRRSPQSRQAGELVSTI